MFIRQSAVEKGCGFVAIFLLFDLTVSHKLMAINDYINDSLTNSMKRENYEI